MYQVRTEVYSGPLEKLLELIEEKKLDINQVSLAKVTADFLSYVESIKSEIEQNPEKKTQSLRILADFLVVASQLILIKSKSLLPNLILSEEEESSIHELENRLKIYSQLKPMFNLTKKQWTQSQVLYSRPMLLSWPKIFYPPKKISLEMLSQSLQKLINSLGTLIIEQETIKKQLFTLEDKIMEVTKKITQGISRFSQIISNKAKEEIIVLFLALLHLLRENAFVAKQEKLFDDISIEKPSNLS
jgi:segregation and condensation protein A